MPLSLSDKGIRRDAQRMTEISQDGSISRRTLLTGVFAGAATGFLGLDLARNSAMAAAKSVTLGTFRLTPTDRLSTKNFLTMAAKAGFDLKLNEIDHLILQSHLTSYMQSNPDDVAEFGSGYRLQYAIAKGLVADISDVWAKVGNNFARNYKTSSTGSDSKPYLLPLARYPWAVMYRKSIFKAAGIEPSTIVTWLDFISACKIFKSKGLTPIAMGDSSGWEALGTFDFVNLRTNGYKFHRDLMSGRATWSNERVQKTFRNWESMLPYQNSNALELDWAGAGRLVLQTKAAMQVMGSFHSQLYTDPNDMADLALFPFPEISKAHHRASLVAPLDGFIIPKAAQKNISNAKSFLQWIGSTEFASAFAAEAPTTLLANGNLPTSDSAFVRQLGALVKSSKYFTQSLDRDTRPDFAVAYVAPAIQSFLKNPGDKKKIAANLATQWSGLPTL